MANAKKCDVCGKFYIQEEKKIVIDGYKVCQVSINTSIGNHIREFDVCDDCAKDVYDLLEGKVCIHREKAV